MITATLAPDKEDIQRRRIALGWSQNELARRIKKDPGLVSRWLRGQLTSSIIAGRVQRILDQAERKLAAKAS